MNVDEPVDEVVVEAPSRVVALRAFLERFARDRVALVALVVLAIVVALVAVGPWLAPQDPYDLATLEILDAQLAPGSPSTDGTRHYLLGTDSQGRDMLSAIVYGLRLSVVVGVASALIAGVVGIVLGLAAGYLGGRVDALVMRAADLQLSFPSILIALILLAFLRPGVGNIVIALVAVQWAYYARTVRASALVERQKEYILAARALGLPVRRIVFAHLLPNCLPPLVIVATLQIAAAIALEATLSFLGLGVPITEPSLGLLIANGFQVLFAGQYWISVYPGVALVVLIVALNLVADRLRDLLDPRLSAR